MGPNHAVGISGRIIAEFEDDASQFLSAEPQFVPSPAPSASPRLVTPVVGSVTHPFLSRESAAVAKDAWMRIVKRFTEPVQGEEGRVEVAVPTEHSRGLLAVECRGGADGSRSSRSFGGYKFDLRDDVFLTIFSRSESDPTQQPGHVCEQSFVIPWAEIVSIQFQCSHPIEAADSEKVA